mmetsp:Transcript_27928/g.59794  ORF Transcript_27928/g.59794 Transcript_27928/m.59794 type:complete len:288 (-) Transcript_27928:149-1012(-)
MRIRKNNKQKYIQWCKNDDTKCYSFSWNRSIVSRQRCLPAVVGVASGNTRAARVRAALLSLLFPLFLVRPRRCLGRLLLVLLPGELLLLFLRLQPLGLPRPGDGGRDLEPPRPRGQLSNDRGQLGHQRPLRVQVALQHGGIDPDPAGVVPEGRRVAAVSLVGLRDVPDAHRCEGLADVLDRGGVDGLLGTDPPALFYRLGRVEVAGVDHKEVGGVHRKTFLNGPEHLEIAIGSRWQVDHFFRWNHEFLHRIGTARHLFHHVLLGLGGARLLDADPSSLFLPHGRKTM